MIVSELAEKYGISIQDVLTVKTRIYPNGRNGHGTHGHHPRNKPSLTYVSWTNLIARCTNTNATSYSRYGGAGVAVCDQWKAFENFLADLGERPKGTTLGRILDLGNYEPGNCFWMTKAEQGLARRNKCALLKWAARLQSRFAAPLICIWSTSRRKSKKVKRSEVHKTALPC